MAAERQAVLEAVIVLVDVQVIAPVLEAVIALVDVQVIALVDVQVIVPVGVQAAVGVLRAADRAEATSSPRSGVKKRLR